MFKSYVCVKQHDITDCGAACLATVARTHGLKIPATTIRHYARTDRHGTNVLGLLEAAQHLGFEAKGVKATPEALASIPLPAVAHVRIGDLLHYVVIHKVTERHITVADPAQGIIRHTREEFAAIWSGILVLLTPSATFRVGDRGVSVWRRFARLLEPHDFLLAETFLATLFLMVLGLGASVYIQLVVDRAIVGQDWALLGWLSLGMFAIVFARAAFGAVRGVMLAHIGQKIDASLMLEYYRHVMKMPMQFFDTRRDGEIISRMGDALKIRDAVSGASLSLLVDTSVMIAAFGVLSFYSLRLALLSLAVLPLLALVAGLISRPLKRAQRATMEAAATFQSHLVEELSGVATLKALGAEEAAGFKVEQKIMHLLRCLFTTTLWGLSTSVTCELITGLGMAAALYAAGTMVMRGQLTVGQMVAFYSILLYTFQPMLRLISVHQTIQDAVVATERLGEILDLEPEAKNKPGQIMLPADAPGEIVFESVTFRYGTRAQVLNDITLRIPPRSTVAIVGESGSGKTSLAKLLLRHYDPSGGRIALDGYDLRDLRLDALRARIGYVEQEPFLFSGTIEENLIVGNPQITGEAMIGAVRAAGLEQFIDSLPARFQTQVGERGLSLSGGQRQRLAIARALARDPRILIFDEATSNLDPQTEQVIQRTIESLKLEKTIIIIAHRLSSVRHADHIVVLDGGRVLEQGTHRQLLQAQGRYHDMWRTQFAPPDATEEAPAGTPWLQEAVA